MKRSPAKVAARLVQLALEQGFCVVDGVGIDLVDRGTTLQCGIRRGSVIEDGPEPRPLMALIQYDLERERSEEDFRTATEALVSTACCQLVEAPGITTRH